MVDNQKQKTQNSKLVNVKVVYVSVISEQILTYFYNDLDKKVITVNQPGLMIYFIFFPL